MKEMDTRLRTGVDHVIDQALASGRIIGMVVLIARDGEIAYQRAAGLADRELGKKMQIDTLFRFASLTKPIVSTAAMILLERGQLALDDPITRWLPEFRPAMKNGDRPTITVRQLLTHTSGLNYGFLQTPDSDYHRTGISDGMDAPGRSMEDNLARLQSVPLMFRPGEGWQYSLSIDVLGAVIERVTGQTLPDAMMQLITAPLSMMDTGFTVRDVDRLAVAYADGPNQPILMGEHHLVSFLDLAGISLSPARVFNLNSFPSGGTGMVGTASDFLTFLETIRKGGSPLIKPETVAAMMSNQIGDLGVNALEPGWRFGFGGAVLKDAAQAGTPQSAGTWRWGGVYGHSWFVDPVQRLTVIGLTNTAVEGMAGRFPTELRNAVYNGSAL